MATITVKNPNGTAAILYAADYLAKKYRQTEKEYAKPMKALETEFEDENGQRWRLTFGPVASVEPPAE